MNHPYLRNKHIPTFVPINPSFREGAEKDYDSVNSGNRSEEFSFSKVISL